MTGKFHALSKPTPRPLLMLALCMGAVFFQCKTRENPNSSGTLSRSDEALPKNADLSQLSSCIKDPATEGGVLCVPSDEYVLQQNISALKEDGNSVVTGGARTLPPKGLSLDAGYAAGTLNAEATVAPDQNHSFQNARIEKCYRGIHVFIGVTVTWSAKDGRSEAATKKYVTGANKSDDGTVYANGQASCSEIVTLTSETKFSAYVRRVPEINDAANPAGVSVFTGVCAPLTGAPCHNAVYEHCVYLKGSGDLANSVGVAPIFLKCLDSIFGN